MSNTLTNLIPAAYRALDIVSRELTGLISSVTIDAAADTVAKGATIYSPVTSPGTLGNITPAMTVTAAADQTIASKTLAITNFKTYGLNWEAEEEFGISTGGSMEALMVNQLAQGMRAHVNAIELALAVAARNGASRAIGTAGTAPGLTDIAGIKKILDDNGAPSSDRSIIIDTTAGVAFRNIANLFQVNTSGDSNLLRQGILGDLYGFGVRESAGILPTASGSAGAYTTTAAGFAIGTTSIPLISGSGTILAGDVVTFAGDTANKYVVTTGVTGAGTLEIAAPGLRVAMSAATKAVTVLAASTGNIALSRNAITLATRLPKFQANDLCADRQVITDPRTGISFELSMWPGQRMVKYEISLGYGMSVIKPEHLAVLLG